MALPERKGQAEIYLGRDEMEVEAREMTERMRGMVRRGVFVSEGEFKVTRYTSNVR